MTADHRPAVSGRELAELRDGCRIMVTRLRYLRSACPPPHGDPYQGDRLDQIVAWLEEVDEDLGVWQESLEGAGDGSG